MVIGRIRYGKSGAFRKVPASWQGVDDAGIDSSCCGHSCWSGNAFTSSSLLKIAPWLGLPAVSIFLLNLQSWGNIVMAISQSSLPYAWPMDLQSLKKATAALCGFFLGYMTMNAVMGTFLTKKIGTIDPKNLVTGQASILGIITLTRALLAVWQ